MKTGRSRIAEALFRTLLPPASREEGAAPFHQPSFTTEIVKQIRSKTELRIFLLQAYAICYSFTAGAFRSDRPSFIDDPLGLIRLAIPVVAGSFGLLLRNAYADQETRKYYAPTVDVAVAFSLAFLTQPVLALLMPEFMLARGWAPTQGGLAGLVFLSGLRALYPPQPKALRNASLNAGLEISVEEARWKAEDFETQVRQWNGRGYLIAAAISAVFILYFALTSLLTARAGCGVMISGAIYLAAQIRKRGSPKAIPAFDSAAAYDDFSRGELERQRALLRQVSYWYFASVLPGIALCLIGAKLYAFFVLMYLFLLAELIHRAAQKLQGEVDELNSRRP